MKMFSGDSGHPQRSGPYVFAQSLDKSFVVQVCHRHLRGPVSVNSMVAVKTPEGIYKYTGGTWRKPMNASATCLSNTCTFADGERVSMSGSHVWVRLGSKYCHNVQGMCGNYNPDAGFADA